MFWISAENHFFDGPPAYLSPGNLFMVMRRNMAVVENPGNLYSKRKRLKLFQAGI
jgi:hypothetical protein